jgi:hypothetical protein
MTGKNEIDSKDIIDKLNKNEFLFEKFFWIITGNLPNPQPFILLGFQEGSTKDENKQIVEIRSQDVSGGRKGIGEMIEKALTAYKIWDDLRKTFSKVNFFSNHGDRKSKGDVTCDDPGNFIATYLNKYPKLKIISLTNNTIGMFLT